MSKPIDFWVAGVPAPGGSKKAFYNPKLGRAIITEDNKRSKPWRALVSQAAIDANTEVLDGPLRARFDFVVLRPKGHYRSGKNSHLLRDGAPPYPDVKPDASKLGRGTEDALKGLLWRDDSQIVTQVITKRYGDQAGCRIRLTEEKE